MRSLVKLLAALGLAALVAFILANYTSYPLAQAHEPPPPFDWMPPVYDLYVGGQCVLKDAEMLSEQAPRYAEGSRGYVVLSTGRKLFVFGPHYLISHDGMMQKPKKRRVEAARNPERKLREAEEELRRLRLGLNPPA